LVVHIFIPFRFLELFWRLSACLERVQHFFDKVGDEVTRLISNQRLLTSSPTIKTVAF
jgi:hypothetical protein